MALQDRDTALVTSAAVKTYLNIDNTAEDTRIANLILRASEAISSWCGRKFAQTTHTDYYDGDGSNNLYLPHYPITVPFASSSGIWVDSNRAFNDGDKLTEETLGGSTSGDFVVAAAGDEQGCGRVIRLDGVFPRGNQNVKAVWQGGYATIPNEIQHAAFRTIGAWLEVATSKMHASVSESLVSGGSVSLIDHHNLPADVKDILARWRRPWTSG